MLEDGLIIDGIGGIAGAEAGGATAGCGLTGSVVVWATATTALLMAMQNVVR